MVTHYTAVIQQADDDSLFVELPDELLVKAGWSIGDVLEWLDNYDGSWTLRKKL